MKLRTKKGRPQSNKQTITGGAPKVVRYKWMHPWLASCRYYTLGPKFKIKELRGATVQPKIPIKKKYKCKLLWGPGVGKIGRDYTPGDMVIARAKDLIPESPHYPTKKDFKKIREGVYKPIFR